MLTAFVIFSTLEILFFCSDPSSESSKLWHHNSQELAFEVTKPSSQWAKLGVFGENCFGEPLVPKVCALWGIWGA